MTGFDRPRPEEIDTAALKMRYALVPWDSGIVGRPVAEILDIGIADAGKAARDYEPFARWCETQEIALCSCRLLQTRIAESMFLEERGFRFIELNYRPELAGLQMLNLPVSEFVVEVAAEGDAEALADMAERIFAHGRFHQDPRIDTALGNCRYRIWMLNAFRLPQQTVLKCVHGGKTVGFFVVEYPRDGSCFWSLVGLAPDAQGQGLGKRVWRAMLRFHQQEGIDTVATSISSHNIPAMNLYVGLGFRFPEPSITLHWRPAGAPVLT